MTGYEVKFAEAAKDISENIKDLSRELPGLKAGLYKRAILHDLRESLELLEWVISQNSKEES